MAFAGSDAASSRRLLGWAVAGVLVLGVVAGVGCLVARTVSPGALEIRVLDGEMPVPGALATLTGRVSTIGKPFQWLPSGPTDGGGVAVFEGVDSGEHALLVAHDDYVFHDEPGVVVVGAKRTVHRVTLRRGARIRGRLLDADGSPLAKANVQVATSGLPAFTAADGRFQTRAVEPGVPLDLRVHHFAGERAIVASLWVPVPAIGVNDVGEVRVLDTETELRLEGEEPTSALRLRGTVAGTDAAGTDVVFEFANVAFVEASPKRIVGLPDGTLAWTLYEVRLGAPPNETIVGEGRSDLAGPRRVLSVRRNAPGR
jgi:hypothetical protein